MNEPIWLRADVLIAAHRRQLAEHGGLDGMRDEGAFLSALDKPRNLFAYGQPEPDLYALAAAYGFGLARNHPFADGNKRTALIAMRLFLKVNGAEFSASSEEKYRMIVALAAGDLLESEVADWLRNSS
ncbi:type II toxin-antitoxin system death-on-curing family toxin [Thalassobius litoralis]|jgi:death-on-curing protein|nr:type II toxin-antitoxin system death-on-curing family toxin [Thalassovita litoralis]